ncbi:hypothetical protein N0V84_010345 [Fusarium piperis]|uniref:Uncharacterized protein n=1 Tax=Fusarium piperis TaxID=1435070 RepID=A0A9W8W1Q4_9HYPO|nr:hypothetical protein N0V84_010345 [Fusarium piperis]
MSNRIPEANTPNRESSPNRRLYTAATPIRFAPHGLDDNVVILDPRNVQQWQLDACEARLDETASQMAKYKERVQELEFLAGNSADTEAEDQAALRDELEMLREELGKMIISQQQKAQAEEETRWAA